LEKQGVYLLVRWVPKEVQQGHFTPANAPQEQAPVLKNEAPELKNTSPPRELNHSGFTVDQ
jgi:hypothetical protein